MNASMRMLPRLEAEESYLAAERMAVGAGRMNEHAVHRVRRRWDDAREGGTRPRRGTPQLISALGIKVKTVPLPAQAPDGQ